MKEKDKEKKMKNNKNYNKNKINICNKRKKMMMKKINKIFNKKNGILGNSKIYDNDL